jgi:hypothetical protein
MTLRTLVCDIDSTLTDHWKRIRRNTKPQWPGNVIDPKAWTREEVMKDKLLPNCLRVLNELKARGFLIRYLSARGWADARAITMDQLFHFHVPNSTDITLTDSMRNKVDLLNKSMCDFYVDDFMTGQEKAIGTFHKDVACAIEEKGIHVIPFRNDWLDVLEQIDRYLENE